MNKKSKFFTMRGQLIIGLTISFIALASVILPIITIDQEYAESRTPLVKSTCDYATPNIVWSGEIMTVNKVMKFCNSPKVPRQIAIMTFEGNPIYPTNETMTFATFNVSEFDFQTNWKVVALSE